jgi:hypothetical protein
MSYKERGVKKWLAENRQEMICCPYQPGQLMISKQSCSKRYEIGQREDFDDLMKGDVFNYAYKKGLSLCRNCPIGKKLAIARPVVKDGAEHRNSPRKFKSRTPAQRIAG